MRTTSDECASLGAILAEKLNRSIGPVTVFLPLRGGSVISAPGGPFQDENADRALYTALKTGLRPDIPVVEIDRAINDAEFAEACAQALLKQLGHGYDRRDPATQIPATPAVRGSQNRARPFKPESVSVMFWNALPFSHADYDLI